MNPSSQSLAPLSRLLWKEYRVQRSLWIAMLVLGVVPQLLFRAGISDQIGRVGAVWSMVIVLPFLFVIGSAAILFAGEREERTIDWLHNLAAPPLWTLLAKWSFLLMATAALAIVLSIVALALVWTVPTADLPQDREDNVIRTLWMFAGVFLWGVLGSLVSRRVITSVPAMGFWCLITLLVPVISIPALFGIMPNQSQYQYVSQCLVVAAFVAVALANLVLGWRWCQGQYLDATILDGANTVFVAWQNRLRWQRVPTVRTPSKPEVDSQWAREWQRFVWQERHRDRYHQTLLYLGCSVSLMLAIMSMEYGSNIMLGIVLLIVILPLAMGVLGFRYDGEGQPLRFLTNRGIEARMLWLAKHAVWLPRAIWMPLVVWLVAGVVEKMTGHNYTGPPGRELLNAVWLIQTYPGGVLGFILLTYGCGHLAATLCRRVVLAAVVGVAASLIATLWLVLAIALQVPMWWSVGGLLLWIYGVGYWIVPAWLMERSILNRPRRLIAFVVPPILLIAAWGTWRAYEIPGLATNLLWGNDQLINPTARSLANELANPANSQTDADLMLLNRLASTLGGGFHRLRDFELQLHRGGPAANDPHQPVDPVEAFWHNNEPRLTELLEITRSMHGPSMSHLLQLADVDPLHTGGLLPQQELLLEAGRLRTKEGRLDDAFAYFCSSLRLASYWATDRGLSTRLQAQRQQLFTLKSIVEWANHPDQTSHRLLAAREQLQTEFNLFPPMQQTLVAQHREELATLMVTIQHGIRSDNLPSTAAQILLQDYSRFLPWEQTRARRWLEQQLLIRDTVATQLATGLQRVPGADFSRQLEDWRTGLSQLEEPFLTPLAPSGSQDIFAGLSLLIEREVVVRESLLALSLLAWKLDHNQWPDSLGDLLVKTDDGRALPAITTVDPWSGEQFHYGGRLLNHLEDNQNSAEVLATVGPSHLREVFVDNPREASSVTSAGVGIDRFTSHGLRMTYDDRLLLKLVDGKLVFQLMNNVRFNRKNSDETMGTGG